MKAKYIKPEIEVTESNSEDIIRTSGTALAPQSIGDTFDGMSYDQFTTSASIFD